VGGGATGRAASPHCPRSQGQGAGVPGKAPLNPWQTGKGRFIVHHGFVSRNFSQSRVRKAPHCLGEEGLGSKTLLSTSSFELLVSNVPSSALIAAFFSC